MKITKYSAIGCVSLLMSALALIHKYRKVLKPSVKHHQSYTIPEPYKIKVDDNYENAYKDLNKGQKFIVNDIVATLLHKNNNHYTDLSTYGKTLQYLDTHYEYRKNDLQADLHLSKSATDRLVYTLYHQHLINIPTQFSQINNKLVSQTVTYLSNKNKLDDLYNPNVSKIKDTVAYNYKHCR